MSVNLACPLCSAKPENSGALQLHLQRHHLVPADRADELTTEAELGLELHGARQSGAPVCAAASAADPKPVGRELFKVPQWPLPVDLAMIVDAIPTLDFAKLTLPVRVLLGRASRSLAQANEGTRAEFAKQLARALERALKS